MKKLIYIIYSSAVLLVSCGVGSDTASMVDGNSIEGSTARFTMNFNNLFLLNGNTLESYELASNGELTLYDARVINSEVETIFSRGDALFLGTRDGMYIFLLDSNRVPNFKSFYRHIISCDPVVADQKYAFLTLNNTQNNRCNRGVNRLEIIDIENLEEPVLRNTYAMSSPRGLGIDDSLLFVCDNKLKVYNRSNVDSIVLIDQFDVRANDVIPYDGHLFLTSEYGFYQYSYFNNELILLSTILIGQ